MGPVGGSTGVSAATDAVKVGTQSGVESRCERCGGPNVTWFAPSEIWNAACPDSDIVCPVCFCKAAECAGFNKHAWRIAPEFSDDNAPKITQGDDSALLDWADRTGHYDARYASLREELRDEGARLDHPVRQEGVR